MSLNMSRQNLILMKCWSIKMNRIIKIRLFGSEKAFFGTDKNYMEVSVQDLYSIVKRKKQRPFIHGGNVLHFISKMFWIVCPECDTRRSSALFKDNKNPSYAPDNIVFKCRKCSYNKRWNKLNIC